MNQICDKNEPYEEDAPCAEIEFEQDVWLAVEQDMKDRRGVGKERYGCGVNVDDGRDSLQDAYEEQLDQVVYLKNEILKRNKKLREIPSTVIRPIILKFRFTDTNGGIVDRVVPNLLIGDTINLDLPRNVNYTNLFININGHQ